jgi:hypothetical protein
MTGTSFYMLLIETIMSFGPYRQLVPSPVRTVDTVLHLISAIVCQGGEVLIVPCHNALSNVGNVKFVLLQTNVSVYQDILEAHAPCQCVFNSVKTEEHVQHLIHVLVWKEWLIQCTTQCREQHVVSGGTCLHQMHALVHQDGVGKIVEILYASKVVIMVVFVLLPIHVNALQIGVVLIAPNLFVIRDILSHTLGMNYFL